MTDQSLYNMAEQVIVRARQKGVTIATAESCTGGWIGKALTDIPGSSKVFKGGLIAYANDVKENQLSVPGKTLMQSGAVSQATAHAMAKNCRQSFDVNIAVSVTGIAGPGGGSKDKPVGLIFMGLSDEQGTQTFEFQFDSLGRDSIRRDAVEAALNLALKSIDNMA